MPNESAVSLRELTTQPLIKPTSMINGSDLDSPSNDGYTVWHEERPVDHACGHVALAIVGLCGLLGLTSVIGGASLLSSIAPTPFSSNVLLRGVGLGSTIVGVLAMVGITWIIWRIHTGEALSRYGACLFPHSQATMVKVRRVVLSGVLPFIAAIVLTLLTIGSIALYTLSITVAPLDRDYYSIDGLHGVVTITRDADGLTHIQASTRRDAYFGQGFAEAQDRLWQLEFLRLAGSGRLAEFVGSDGLKMDKQTRTLNIRQAAADLCRTANASQLQLMQGFVDGINFYLHSVNERPPEFLFMSKRLLFFHEPETFTVDDVCLYARLLQWQLSFNVPLEVDRFKIFWKTNRSYDEVEELYLNQTNISHTILTTAQLNLTEADAVAARARESRDHDVERLLYNTYMTNLRQAHGPAPYVTSPSPSAPLRVRTENSHRRRGMLSAAASASKPDWNFLKWKAVHASNAWASRADSDACGASDPHLDINLPSVWYYSHLQYPFADDGSDNRTFDTAGVGMVGVPGVHIGKTTFVSWGITMSLTDLEDLFLLVPDPANPQSHYMVNGTSIALTQRVEVIHVKGEDDVTLFVEESIYGPVVTDAFELPQPLKFAITAQPLIQDNTSITSVLNLGSPNIRSVVDLRNNAFGLMRSPGFSIPMADNEGNIGYTMTGAHVVRAVGHTGKYPTIGNGSFNYIRELAFAELPTLMMLRDSIDNVPVSISAANQKTYPDGYAYTLGYDFAFPFRGGRIQTLLQANPTQLSNRSFHRDVQSDLHSNVWAMMSSWMNASTVFQSGLTANGQQWWTSMTSQWDGSSTKGSVFPSFLFLWIRALSAVPHDVIQALDIDYWSPGDNYPFFMLSNPTPLMLRQCSARLQQASNGPDACTTYAVEQWNALAAAYTTSTAPKWGVDLNILTGQHLMMHGTILADMFERSIGKDGDYSTIDVSDFASEIQGSMSPTAASSMRQLYDWSNPETVWFALPGGDSGNPYSDRFDNLLAPFGDDLYVNVQVTNLTAAPSHHQLLSPHVAPS